MEVLPLNAIVYNQNKVDIKDVVAPPYDVIDSKYQDELYDRSEFNIVRLILGKEEDRYSSAKKYFEEWKEKQVLIKTEKPAIFYIVQKYKNEKGKMIERKGFIARNKIESFESKKILPHEFTMGGPKEDRFKLVSATGAFYSQIFMVYEDKTQRIESEVAAKYLTQEPFMNIVDDLGVQNLIYLIQDEADIKIITDTLADKTLLIADGHHRCETSMRYASTHPENKYAQYVMSYFTNASDENLVIYPTHRIIEKNIEPSKILEAVMKHYDIIEVSNKEEFLDRIEFENKNQITTGLILKNSEKYYVLKLKEGQKELVKAPKELQELDLMVLHELILKNELGYTQDELMAQDGIKYEKKENVSFESIKNGASACFIMAYPKMKDIINISSAGLRMFLKS